jgi:hypothetical protein
MVFVGLILGDEIIVEVSDIIEDGVFVEIKLGVSVCKGEDVICDVVDEVGFDEIDGDKDELIELVSDIVELIEPDTDIVNLGVSVLNTDNDGIDETVVVIVFNNEFVLDDDIVGFIDLEIVLVVD